MKVVFAALFSEISTADYKISSVDYTISSAVFIIRSADYKKQCAEINYSEGIFHISGATVPRMQHSVRKHLLWNTKTVFYI